MAGVLGITVRLLGNFVMFLSFSICPFSVRFSDLLCLLCQILSAVTPNTTHNDYDNNNDDDDSDANNDDYDDIGLYLAHYLHLQV